MTASATLKLSEDKPSCCLCSSHYQNKDDSGIL